VKLRVFCNRKPGLRLESARFKNAELLAYLVDEEKNIYIGVLVRAGDS